MMRGAAGAAAAFLLALAEPALAEIQVVRGTDGAIVASNRSGGAYARPAGTPAQPRAEVAASPSAPGELAALIDQAARRHGLSSDLILAVVATESAFDPGAVSPKGARGLMQLMPNTAEELGVTDLYDPQRNLEGGVRHLRALLDSFEGNLPLALAAYNAGETAVRRYGGVPPYPETQDYVRKVLRLAGTRGVGSALLGPRLVRYRDSKGTFVMSNVPAKGLRNPIQVAALP